jgi:class 3 adenylate cyclase
MINDSKKTPVIVIPSHGTIRAFAMIVDLNRFAGMVKLAEQTGDIIAQFTRDVLSGAIDQIESEGGEVVGFMGDAVYGVLPSGDRAVKACFGIAKYVDRHCEYISSAQARCKHLWAFAKGGASLKIAVEYGVLDVSTIYSRLLGSQPLLVGNAVNYASRIAAAGKGNRCNIGPIAAKMEFSKYHLDGPFIIKGKFGEPPYEYFNFRMDDIWIEGPRRRGKETFWG